jgi:hypothetical protein
MRPKRSSRRSRGKVESVSDAWAIVFGALISFAGVIIGMRITNAATSRRELALLKAREVAQLREARLLRLFKLLEDLPLAKKRLFRHQDGSIQPDMAELVSSVEELCSFVEQRVVPNLDAAARERMGRAVVPLRSEVGRVMDDFSSGKEMLNFRNSGHARQLADLVFEEVQHEIDRIHRLNIQKEPVS